MSYLPYRDNPDLAGVGEVTQTVLENLAEHIDASAQRALHTDQCGCDRGEDCPHYPHGYQAHAEETLGWLVAEGLLDGNAVVRWLSARKPARIGIPAPEMADYLRKAQRAAQPGVEDRARRGEFAVGDVVAADMGAPLRPIWVPAVVTLLEDRKVLIQGDVGDVYDTHRGRLRHARVVSDMVCELYGAKHTPAGAR